MSLFLSTIRLVVVLSMCIYVSDAIRRRYLDDYCGQKLYVEGDVLISISKWFPQHCSVILRPKQSSNLVASFTYYKFSGLKNLIGQITGDCNFESLQLESSKEKIFGPDGYCDYLRPVRQYDLGTNGTFTFKPAHLSLQSSMRADLLVTETYEKSNLVNRCGDGQFDCKNSKNYCISSDLKCNGYDDCGNDKDEIEGCGLSIPIIVGIVIGCICFVIVVVVIGVCIAKRH